MGKITPPQRIDPIFEKEMRDIAKIRLEKGLAKFNPKALSIREMTNLLTKTEGFRKSMEELKIKPKRK